MKKNREYLTTGEFAELFGVKKQTMFHYDDMGIFRPEIVGENGYRYYSYDQMETFSIILMLRELGLSIAEIRDQIDSRSPEALVELLDSKGEEIDAKIRRLNWSKEYIGRKSLTTREGIGLKDASGKLRTGEVLFQELPDEIMITTDLSGPGDDRTVNKAVGDHFRYLRSLGMNSCYPDGATIPRDSVEITGEEVNFRYDRYYTILTDSEAEHLKENGELEKMAVEDGGGKFIVTYDERGYSTVGACIRRLLDYAEKHELELGKDFYEDVIWDDLSGRNTDNYLIKISIRVK